MVGISGARPFTARQCIAQQCHERVRLNRLLKTPTKSIRCQRTPLFGFSRLADDNASRRDLKSEARAARCRPFSAAYQSRRLQGMKAFRSSFLVGHHAAPGLKILDGRDRPPASIGTKVGKRPRPDICRAWLECRLWAGSDGRLRGTPV